MKLHIITIGKPKLSYAAQGFEEYTKRLQHYHSLRITHIPDKQNDATHILQTIGSSYLVALVIDGQQFSSLALAEFLDKRAREAREVCFVIGGPEGLPAEVIASADTTWGLSKLTFPHDLAMVVLAETLYRASTIGAGIPYHK